MSNTRQSTDSNETKRRVKVQEVQLNMISSSSGSESTSSSSTSSGGSTTETTVPPDTGRLPELPISPSLGERVGQILIDLITTGLVVFMAAKFGVDDLRVTGGITGGAAAGALLLDGWHTYQKSQESLYYTSIGNTLGLRAPEVPKSYLGNLVANLGLSNRVRVLVFSLTLVAIILLSVALARNWGDDWVFATAVIGGGLFHLARRWFDSDVAKNIHQMQQQVIRQAGQLSEANRRNAEEIVRLNGLNQVNVDKIAQLTNRNQILGATVKTFESTDLKKENDELKTNYNTLEKKLKSLIEERETLNKQYEELLKQHQVLSNENENLHLRQADLEGKLQTANKNIIENKTELAKVSGQVQNLQNNLQRVSEEKEGLSKQKGILSQQIETLQKERLELNSRITELNSEISKLKGQATSDPNASNNPRV